MARSANAQPHETVLPAASAMPARDVRKEPSAAKPTTEPRTAQSCVYRMVGTYGAAMTPAVRRMRKRTAFHHTPEVRFFMGDPFAKRGLPLRYSESEKPP